MKLYSITTLRQICHFVFEYNCGNSGQILIILVPLKTVINVLPSRYKACHFNLTMSPHYLMKLMIAQKQPTAFCSGLC